MTGLQYKVDFAAIISVNKANPNGDPLNGNRPRIDFNGYGEITDVCIKRKLRDRLQEMGQPIFVQADDRKVDEHPSLEVRAKAVLGSDAFNANKAKRADTAWAACRQWFDVRAFGQIFAFGKEGNQKGVSIPIRGPVTVRSAFSLEPIEVVSTQITKSVSGEGDGTKRGSDTMGMKHRVDRGIYVFFGAMNPQLAERTGFSDEDALEIKKALPRLFENDASSARPEGSMEVLKVIWWQHASKAGQYSSANVHRSLLINSDGSYTLAPLEGLIPEEIEAC